ncbi:LOW QUALITY PROTEIN: hypothetical protein V1478_005424 [Vespula squamosa]|uniref:Uncharacterized protein n=1 Tax=Vespula squamosa TaxID=30214 RepID=A0ABD2BE28_VESSQ
MEYKLVMTSTFSDDSDIRRLFRRTIGERNISNKMPKEILRHRGRVNNLINGIKTRLKLNNKTNDQNEIEFETNILNQ